MAKGIIVLIAVLAIVVILIVIIVAVRKRQSEKALERKLDPLRKSLSDKSTKELRIEISRLIYKQIETEQEDKELDMMVEIYRKELERRSIKIMYIFRGDSISWIQRFLMRRHSDDD